MYYLTNQKGEKVYSSESKLEVKAIQELHNHDDCVITESITNNQKMNKPTAIVISKKGSFSVHNTFSKACALYGWERSKFRTIPKEVKEYKITQIPFDISILCLELMEFASRAKTSFAYESHFDEDQTFHIEISGYHMGYYMIVNVEKELIKPDSSGSEQGCDSNFGGYYIFKAKEVVRVLDFNGEKMIVDEHTEEFLLDLVDIKETEDYD